MFMFYIYIKKTLTIHTLFAYVMEEPGEAEDDFAQVDTKRLMIKFFTNFGPNTPLLPKGVGIKAFPDPPSLPSWLSEEDINYYAGKFNITGFTGGLNYYRATAMYALFNLLINFT